MTTTLPPPAPDARLPRHIQVRDELMRRVTDRIWKAGEALPGEARLAEEFGIAVGTMRKAIQALVHEGVFERIHGKGTFVTRAFERASMLRFVRFRDGGQKTLPEARVLALQTVDTPDAEVRDKLQLAKNRKALYLHRTRAYDGEVVLAEHIWLPLDRFAKLQRYLQKESPPLLYPVYDAVCGVVVARAVDELSMGQMPAEDGALFRNAVMGGSPCMRIERTMQDHAGAVVEWRVSFVPPGLFRYTAEIR